MVEGTDGSGKSTQLMGSTMAKREVSVFFSSGIVPAGQEYTKRARDDPIYTGDIFSLPRQDFDRPHEVDIIPLERGHRARPYFHCFRPRRLPRLRSAWVPKLQFPVAHMPSFPSSVDVAMIACLRKTHLSTTRRALIGVGTDPRELYAFQGRILSELHRC